MDLGTKRRRFGRFIGLRGCESPVQGQGQVGGCDGEEGEGEIDEAMARMEWEWEEALERAAREEGEGFRVKW